MCKKENMLRPDAGAEQRRLSVATSRRLPRRVRSHRRSASMSKITDTPRGTADSVPNFLFQQPAYDPDVYEPQRANANAIGSYKRGWNTQMAVYVKRMGQRAGGYKWMHSQASRWFTKRFQWLGVSCIILNAIATAGNIPYVAVCQSNLDWIKIIAIILGLLVTIAMAFQQFKDYGARRSQHSTSEANYAALYDHIKQQLHKNSRDRQDANDYVEWISKELNDLKASSPLIPPLLLQQYRAMIDGANIADPEGVDEIIIKRDSPERVDGDANAGVAVGRRRGSALVEVLVDSCDAADKTVVSGGAQQQTNIPRAGRLIVTYNDEEDRDPTNSPAIEMLSPGNPVARLALERLRDQ